MKYVHFSGITNPNKVSGHRKLTANLRVDFSTEMDVSASELLPQTPVLRQKCSLGNTSLCYLVWSKLLRLPKDSDSSHCFSPASPQLSSAHGLGHDHGNFGIFHKEFRLPKFTPPWRPSPVLETSVQEENKKSEGLEQEAQLWGQAGGSFSWEGKAGWEKQTVNTREWETDLSSSLRRRINSSSSRWIQVPSLLIFSKCFFTSSLHSA